MYALDTPLTPDGPTARRWLQQELSKSEYQQHKSLWERLIGWLESHLSGASVGGLTIPWYVIAGIVTLAILGLVVYSLRRFQRTPRLTPQTSSTAAVFGPTPRLDATAYREEAERLLESDASAAVLAAYRAVVMHAAEREFVPLTPSTTVHDVDTALCQALPQRPVAVRDAGATFAAVRYGAIPATTPDARAILQLDDVVTTTSQESPHGASRDLPQGSA